MGGSSGQAGWECVQAWGGSGGVGVGVGGSEGRERARKVHLGCLAGLGI